MIPKPGKDLADPSSNRPISLLSCMGKLLEKTLTTRITTYLEDNHLLNPAQAGFRRGHSTIEQFTRLTHSALHSAHIGMCFLALFFDISKAFDKVWHQGLLYKLHRQFSLPSPALKWIQSYLFNNWSHFSGSWLWPPVKGSRRYSRRPPRLCPCTPLISHLC